MVQKVTADGEERDKSAAASGWERWKFLATPIVLILLAVAVNQKWITSEQADAVKTTISVESDGGVSTETTDGGSTVEVTREPVKPAPKPKVEQKPKPAPKVVPKTVVKEEAKPVVVAAMTEDDIKRLIEMALQIIQNIPPPKPVPVPDPKPTPTPLPIPEPTPDTVPPVPGSLRIMVADKTGTPITAATIEAGKWFRVYAKGAKGSVAWQTDQGGAPEYGASGDGSEFSGYLHAGDWVSFTAIDYAGKTNVTMRLSANHAPQPPPKPDTVPPTVEPDEPVEPKPKPVMGLRVMFVYESSQNHTAEQLHILYSPALKAMLERVTTKDDKGGPGWRQWDQNVDASRESEYWRALWKSVKPKVATLGKLPALVVAVGDDVTVQAMPATEADVTKAILAIVEG